MYKLKKAAMFGLDARISLAIFGALSIVAGVALYKIIEKVRITTIISQVEELKKAYIQYYIDTRQHLPEKSASVPHHLDIKYLIKDPGYNNWKGPYIQGDIINKHVGETIRYSKLNLDFDIVEGTDEVEWGGINYWSDSGGYCQKGQKCFAWIIAYNFSYDEAEKINKIIDNDNSLTKGSFRCQKVLNPTLCCFFKGPFKEIIE